MNLNQLGWNEDFEKELQALEWFDQETYTIGRISKEHKGMYHLLTEKGELLAEVSGKFKFHATEREDFPAIGDWVIVSARFNEGKATIHYVLERKSKFSRKVAGNETVEQIVATNVDTVFLVNALNQDFNIRRIERYLILAWESGANPVIILSKADLCENVDYMIRQVESVAIGVPIHSISSLESQGIDEVKQYLSVGNTVALLGSSGVGKSTLINALVGKEIQKVNVIREGDDRGKHTTTHRELIVLKNGGLVIDTPGMREIQLWDVGEGISDTFKDIEELAQMCKFRDCTHNSEPGCGINQAISQGTLTDERFQSYVKLQKELAYLERKQSKKAQIEEKHKWKKIAGDRTRLHR